MFLLHTHTTNPMLGFSIERHSSEIKFTKTEAHLLQNVVDLLRRVLTGSCGLLHVVFHMATSVGSVPRKRSSVRLPLLQEQLGERLPERS